MSDIILGILLGFGVTILFIYLHICSLVTKILADIHSHVARVAETLMPIFVERVNDQIYCYDENKQFICQGATVADIREAFAKRFPDKTAYLDGGDEELVKELQAEIGKDPHVKVD